MHNKLFWKLFLGNAVLMAIMLGICAWLITDQVDRFYRDELSMSLHSQAESLRQLLTDKFDPSHAAYLQRAAHQIGRDDPAGVRITLIDADGVVLADSMADPATMEPHGGRLEVREALQNGWGEETRLSHTFDRSMKYVAVRVGSAEAPTGVVRVAMPLRTIGQRAESIRRMVWGIVGIALATAMLFALGLARLWSSPIRRITATAHSLSRGDLSSRVKVIGSDELAGLARSFNQMRDSLAAQIETINGQRELLESLLAHLRDSVIVVGPDGRIVRLNAAARRLLEIQDGQGESLQLEGIPADKCVPQPELRRILLGPPGHEDNPVQQVRLSRLTGDVSLLASISPIALPGAETGRLVVLTDVTQLTRMIQVKADFASNASHELRTPLTAIRAAVETLQQIDPTEQPDRHHKFLDVIDRHSSRMESIVADLLNLSRIESAPSRFKPAVVNPREVLDEIHERVSSRLEAKHLHWDVRLSEASGEIMANPYLLRLVLENLIENAIKFTDTGGHINVIVGKELAGYAPAVTFTVEDDGCGIPLEEQERVFERFYQVERARTGVERGTGLGLSIVRHAVAAMGGKVRLTSQPEHGTRVTVILQQNYSA